jgi:hypothetical protein
MSSRKDNQHRPARHALIEVSSLDVLGASDVNNISTMPDDVMGTGKSEAFVYKGITLIAVDVKAHFKKDEPANLESKQ